jgi:membrane protease YdiL (CAAX protease family)
MGILGTIAETLVPKVVRRIAAPILLLVLVVYYYINGALIFGTLWGQPGFSNAIIAYLFFIFAAFLLAVVPPKDALAKDLFNPVSAPLWLQLLVFVGVAVMINTVISLSGFRLTPADSSTNTVQIVLFMVAVTGAEELFFRGALFRAKPLISSGAFAAFHAYVYSSSPQFFMAVVIAMIAGVAFYYIYAATRERYGLAVNTAAHLGYNLGLLGVVLIGPLLNYFFKPMVILLGWG